MKKLIALLLAVLMLASVLVACGGGGNTDNTKETTKDSGNTTADNGDPFKGEGDDGKAIELEVWTPELSVTLTENLIKDFEKLYPEKKFDIKVIAMEEGSVDSSVLTDPESAGDIFCFISNQINRFKKAEVLAPIDVYEPSYLDDIKSRDSEESVAAATFDGELLAYPATGENTYYLAYDKSVVSDEDAKTFEGVLEACRKAGRKFNMDGGNGYYACTFVYTGGFKTEGLDENDKQVLNNYNKEEVLDSLEAFANLFREYKDVFQSGSVDDTGNGMALEDASKRSIGAGIDGAWNAATLQEKMGDDYGATTLPTIKIKDKDTQIISINGYKYIGVNDYSKKPYSAHVLANYLAGAEGQTARAKDLGWSPSNKSVVESGVVTNKGSLACLEQAKFSNPQIGIADIFWATLGTLGKTICDTSTDLSRADIEKEFDKAVVAIEDKEE